jgi:glycosyltransferase involved in cell wall biosynthesis
MRVCHVTSLHPPLDVRIFHKECRTLAQAGHDVTLLAQADWEEKVVDGVRIIGLPRISSRYQRLRVWQNIVRRVRALEPDVVHFHDPELLLVAPLFRSARLIYDCHEPVAKTMLVRRWIPRSLRRPVSDLVALLEPVLARRMDRIVITEDSHTELFEKCRCPVVLLYNYPPLGNLEFARHSDGKTILHVGILSEERGAWTMIEAMSLVVQRISDAKLVLVGGFDSPADEVEIRQMIADYRLQDAVDLVGWVPFTALPEWFIRADIGLVPWQTERKFPPRIIPTKMFEYMSYEMPVLASDRPAIRRFMNGLDCGLLIEPGDARGFAEAIEYLLRHPAEARQMGGRGREAVRRMYHWEIEGEKLVALYSQLAQAR